MAEEEAKTVVSASEILDKIQNGQPVEYDNVIIEGDLDPSTLDLPTEQVKRTDCDYVEEVKRGLPETVKVVTSQIKITNSEIPVGNGEVELTKA
jgi:hypothetical protein